MTENLADRLRAAGPTLDVADVADLMGFKRSTFYEAVKTGTAPVRTIRARGRIKVLTASVAEALGVTLADGTDHVRTGETLPPHRRSEATQSAPTTSAVKCCGACGQTVSPAAQRVG